MFSLKFIFKCKLKTADDEDPSLRIESFAIINSRGVSTKLNKHIVFTMQTHKRLITCLSFSLFFDSTDDGLA